MISTRYKQSNVRSLSEKTGTIDHVLWSAQLSPVKLIAVLAFTDGEELASVAVDDTMLSCVEPGRSGTFVFSSAGGTGVLIRLGSQVADYQTWRSAAGKKFVQAIGLALLSACLLASALWNASSALCTVAVAVVLAAGWCTQKGLNWWRVAGLIKGRADSRPIGALELECQS